MTTRRLLASAILLLSACAQGSQSIVVAPPPVGPAGKASYLNVHGQMVRNQGSDVDGPTGGAIEWGSFQTKYVGAGTKIGLEATGAHTGLDSAIFLGAGPAFHIPIGDHVLLMPELNLGYRLGSKNIGFALYGSLGAAYRFHDYYVGLEVERPIYLQLQTSPNESPLFPSIMSGGLFLGLYY